MIAKQEFEFIREKAEEILGITENFELAEADGAYVKICPGKYIIGASDKSLCARSFMLAAQHKDEIGFEVLQKQQFETRGVMLDVSRGGVMRVSAIKKYIDYMSLLGLNALMLYMEDVYEVKEYPLFGYRRGKYSAEELREVDSYGASLGIEVIPCMQTLSHLEQYLHWDEAKDFRTSDSTLLCDEEKTYEFIEAMIRTLASIFKSKRIHIGMDEAHDFCDGEYKRRHGTADKFEVLTRHLNHVVKICKKYGLHPMMWDDMFFKIGSETGDYYDENAVIPEEVKQRIPDVDLVYWDYDRICADKYDRLIQSHMAMGKKIVYAGALWTWLLGYLPNTGFVMKTLDAGLKSSIRNGVSDVFATAWGDDRTECNYFWTLPYLAVVSENCFLGEACTDKDIAKAAKLVTKADAVATAAYTEYHVPYSETDTATDPQSIGKRVFYTDLLYNFTETEEYLKTAKQHYDSAYRVFEKTAETNEAWREMYLHAADIFDVMRIKADIMSGIHREYKNKNREYFKSLSDEILPELVKIHKRIYKYAEKMWLDTNKAFGWENIACRHATVIARTEYIERVIKAFAYGQSDNIEELEFDFIEQKYNNPLHWMYEYSVSTMI